MKRTSDFYRVVNAVINTLNWGDSILCVSGGQGGSGLKYFSPSGDIDAIRDDLLKYSYVEQLDADSEDLYDDWAESAEFDPSFDFYELSGNEGNSKLQVMINPGHYVTSYDLSEMICEDYGFEEAEITTGINGYPSGLRGCVLLNNTGETFEQLEEIAERYGVEIVSLHQRAGWDLWESQGKAFELYNYQDFLDSHMDIVTYSDFRSYAEHLREIADEQEDGEDLSTLADELEDNELGSNKFIWVNANGYADYEVDNILCDNFEYDSHYYTLAFDCFIES